MQLPDALGPGGEHGAPHGGVDRAAGGVVLAEGEQVERHVLEVVGQPLGRPLHLDELDRLGGVGIGERRIELGLVDALPELAHGVLVQGCECGLLRRVVEEQEAPVLLVAARGGPDGRIEDAGLDVEGDGVLLDPAHGARRVQRLVEFHMPGTLRRGHRPGHLSITVEAGESDKTQWVDGTGAEAAPATVTRRLSDRCPVATRRPPSRCSRWHRNSGPGCRRRRRTPWRDPDVSRRVVLDHVELRRGGARQERAPTARRGQRCEVRRVRGGAPC